MTNDKPREFWIDEKKHDGLQSVFVEPVEGCVRVIEYSAYEKLLKERKSYRTLDALMSDNGQICELHDDIEALETKLALQSQIIEDLMGALDELKVYLGELTVTSDPYAPTIVECFIEKPLDSAQAKLKLIRGDR